GPMSVGAVTAADLVQQLPLLRRQTAHALGTNLLQHPIELIEQLLFLGAPAATAGRRGRCRPRAAAGPWWILARHDLQLALAHHPPQSAQPPARRPEAQID